MTPRRQRWLVYLALAICGAGFAFAAVSVFGSNFDALMKASAESDRQELRRTPAQPDRPPDGGADGGR